MFILSDFLEPSGFRQLQSLCKSSQADRALFYTAEQPPPQQPPPADPIPSPIQA